MSNKSPPPQTEAWDAHEEALIDHQREALRGRLFTRLRHDLNNSAGIALGQLELVRAATEDLAGLVAGVPGGAEKSAVALRTLRNGTASAHRAVERMARNFSRASEIERAAAGSPGPVHAAEAIEAAKEFLEVRLKRHELKIQALTEAPGLSIPPLALLQILVIVLDNAVDAIEDSGREGISVIHELHEDEQWIDVRDAGDGVPEAVRPRLFTTFASSKPAAEGLGFGLHIARRIARRHGGELECAATGATGSTFRIRLR